MNKKYARPAEMLQHVLQPSLKIEDKFLAVGVTTDDGLTIQGIIVEQSPAEIVVRTAEKRDVKLTRDQIEAIQKSPKSLMPDSVLSDLTAQEAADLFEYIRSVGT